MKPSGALFDQSGRYRYLLWRAWDDGARRAAFIMLNPSTAGAAIDDPTIRRCIAYARAWGYGVLYVGNLFAYRATDPRALYGANDPIGPENDAYLVAIARRCDLIVCAWGVHGALGDRGAAVLALLGAIAPVYCFGCTKDGHPRHPLYLRRDAPLTIYAKEMTPP